MVSALCGAYYTSFVEYLLCRKVSVAYAVFMKEIVKANNKEFVIELRVACFN